MSDCEHHKEIAPDISLNDCEHNKEIAPYISLNDYEHNKDIASDISLNDCEHNKEIALYISSNDCEHNKEIAPDISLMLFVLFVWMIYLELKTSLLAPSKTSHVKGPRCFPFLLLRSCCQYIVLP